MEPLTTAALAGFLLGLQASIAPCPMAAVVAAVSFIARQARSPRLVIVGGLLLALGMVTTYVALGALIVTSSVAAGGASMFLQKWAGKLLGPVLILVGMVLVGLIRINLPALGVSDRLRRVIERSGVWGAPLLGGAVALSFCPVSAVLFFTALIGLAVKHESPVLLPACYGVGMVAPLFVYASLIAFGVHGVGTVFNRLQSVEKWARPVAGVIIIVAGVLYTLSFVFGVSLW